MSRRLAISLTLLLGKRLVIAVVVALTVVPATAARAQPRAAEPLSPVVVSNAWGELTFSGSPYGDGLLYSVGVPERPVFYWPIAVLNAGATTLRNVHVRAEEAQRDGGRTVYDSDVWIWPADLGPGEVGVGFMYQEQAITGPEDGLDASFRFALIDDPVGRGARVTLPLTGTSYGDGDITATVSNDTDEPVDVIEFHVLCMRDPSAGLLTSYVVTTSMTTPLDPGGSNEITASAGRACGGLFAFALVEPSST